MRNLNVDTNKLGINPLSKHHWLTHHIDRCFFFGKNYDSRSAVYVR